MTSAIIVYLMFGVLSYWPLVLTYKINSMGHLDPWWQWVVAWLVWSMFWPYRYIADAWYWWMAGK